MEGLLPQQKELAEVRQNKDNLKQIVKRRKLEQQQLIVPRVETA